MEFVDIRAAPDRHRREATRILVDALAHDPSAWPDIEAAAPTVEKALSRADRRATLALEDGRLVGWIGAIVHSEHAWELHPLVVDSPAQRRGVGSALVARLERDAADAGVASMWLGCDDAFGGTSIFGHDLYPDPLVALGRVRTTSVHPLAFYQRCGFTVCGVIPDSTGPGRHDILMAKRIGAEA
ncbi:MAG: GNAT family N-acetyltransferase [Maricaulaceae bacterium]|jgi:aminoglycoside 6'-N-acetyltransferase I